MRRTIEKVFFFLHGVCQVFLLHPITDVKGILLIGPLPAEATFVGYPALAPEEKAKPVTQLKEVEKSTDEVNKQYTILQPVAAGSRAADALQEAAREGVPSVAAVPAPAVVEPPKILTPTGTLSPNSIGRGKFFQKTQSTNCGCGLKFSWSRPLRVSFYLSTLRFSSKSPETSNWTSKFSRHVAVTWLSNRSI